MPKSRIVRRARHVALSRSLWNRRLPFLLGSVLVGLAAVTFSLLATAANAFVHVLFTRLPWLAFIVAPAGFAAISLIGARYFAGAQGSGIPQAIAAAQHDLPGLRATLLSLRIALGKILLTLAGLLCGASIGREGPTVQVGAAIMYSMCRLASFPHESMKRALILAGGAAGVAAAFNAPLAGVVFAIEEMARSFSQRTSGRVITAVIFAGIVSLALLGDYTYFGHTNATVPLRDALPAVIACGLVGGGAGGVFARLLIAVSGAHLPGPLRRLRHGHPHGYAALCGLAIALLGLLSSGTIYGTGYGEARTILAGDALTQWFGVLKLVATVVSYATGIPGGIFAPSLAVGAGLGQNIALLLPGTPVPAIAILGMVGYFAGAVQAPLTGFVIVIEMTRDTDMALPLLAVALLAHGTSRLVCPRPLYKALSKAFRPHEAQGGVHR
jgi:H+/Cl- antiporter ClcA